MTYPTFTADGRNAIRLGQLVDVLRVSPGADLERRSRVTAVHIVLVELDVVQLMGPDGERPGTDGLVRKVMPSVLDDQAEIGSPRKIQRQLDLRDVGDGNRVGSVAAQRAVGTLVSERWREASQALVERPLRARRIRGTEPLISV